MLVLDLFCGVGGASAGYVQAGYDVLGVDIVAQPDYPYEFIRGDALAVSSDYLDLEKFDLVHASPPCQTFAHAARKNRGSKFPDLLTPTIALLKASNRPFVIENVPESRIPGTVLCGTMFDLPIIRHRTFMSNFPIPQPRHNPHVYAGVSKGIYVTVAGHGGSNAIGNNSLAAWQSAMQMPWATSREQLAEGIPPAYTRYIGLTFATLAR